MGLPHPKERFTIAQYIEREIAAEIKHEFHDGEILAMSGGQPDHSLINMNFGAAVHLLLRGKPCRIYESNLRIRIPTEPRYLYPDATIFCLPLIHDPEDPSHQSVMNPNVVIEVLSPTTEAHDRGEKFKHYQKIPSFREYVLISQTVAHVETFLRRDDDSWLYTPWKGPSVTLQSVDVVVPFSSIYDGVTFGQG